MGKTDIIDQILSNEKKHWYLFKNITILITLVNLILKHLLFWE